MAARPKADKLLFQIESYPLFMMAHILSATQDRIVSGVQSYRMSPSVWRVISVLAEHDGLSINGLSLRIIVERSALSRILSKLEEDDLVQRRTNPEDQRSTTLHLTARGAALYRECVPIARRELDQMMSALSASEGKTLMNLLRKLHRRDHTFLT